MAGVGGYQRPAKPAPVSGPGALSARTDGGPAQALRDLPNAKYGENADFRAIESGAPMAKATSPASGVGGAGAPSPAPALPMQPPTPLTAPTSRPDEPVTYGAAAGPGPGPSVMALPDVGPQYATVAQTVRRVAIASGNPDIQFLAGLAGEGRF